MTNSDIGNKKLKKKLILTFDDGPHPRWTKILLELLDKYQVKATFFLVGKKVHRFPEIVAEIINQGHIIGNHTWSHRILIATNPDVLKREIYDYHQYFQDKFGYQMIFFRAPWGLLSQKTGYFIEKQFGYEILNWHKDSLDYLLPCSRNLSNKIRSNNQDPLIILFHDGIILSPIFTRKFSIKTVEGLLQLKNDHFEFILPD
jgi:peptidoglycan/xylan/chitin deacetylase (PgdA/CDA1 family)